ncbi:MAG: propanediol dehydratase [Arachnia propionica]|nr:MAG: propanediol dehydratase [Arachnia propionica]
MDQEQLIHQIMAEVMKNLGDEQVSFAKVDSPAAAVSPASAPTATATKVRREDYPLAEKHPELVQTNTGRSLSELTFEAVKAGSLTSEDFRISSETLELQAQVADASGRPTLARNMRRAAELVRVPDERLLEIYSSLRPYRSTKEELLAIAQELEGQYAAKASADFVREAAAVYERRGRLRTE